MAQSFPTFYMLLPGTAFEANPDWYYSFEYLSEKQRGQDYQKLLRHPVIDRMTEEEIGSQKDKRQTGIETKQLAIDWQRAGNPLGRYR